MIEDLHKYITEALNEADAVNYAWFVDEEFAKSMNALDVERKRLLNEAVKKYGRPKREDC